jgi:hypothetical protein
MGLAFMEKSLDFLDPELNGSNDVVSRNLFTIKELR